MELFEKIVNSWKSLAIFAQNFILDILIMPLNSSLLNLTFNSLTSNWDFMAYTLTAYKKTPLYGYSFYVLVLALLVTPFCN